MDRFDMMWEPVRAFLVQVGEFFPRVMLALVILLAGWLIAKAVRFAVVKALRAINFNVLTERAGIDTFLKQGGGETDTTDILGLADLLAHHPHRADDRVEQRRPDRRHRAGRAGRAVRAQGDRRHRAFSPSARISRASSACR